RTELPRRASKPPAPLDSVPCAHTEAVDSSDVVRVGTLPKIGCRSSSGARKLPILNVPQLPCRPANVSRDARTPPPVSADTFDSIWKIALSPPPRDSVPRTPRRDEFVLTWK